MATSYPALEAGVVEVAERQFIRPVHELVRRGEAVGQAILPRDDSVVVGFDWWHDCRGHPEGGFWLEVPVPFQGQQLQCEVCGALAATEGLMGVAG